MAVLKKEYKNMKKTKMITFRMPLYLADCIDALSSKYKYLTRSNIIKLGIMSILEDYGVTINESHKVNIKY